MWRLLNAAVAAALLAPPQAPRGWTTLFDVTGRCYYAVPPDWKVDELSETVNAIAASADGALTASIHWSAHVPWDKATTDLRGMTQPKRVHDDSDRRYWLEIDEPGARVLHVAVIPSASRGACTIDVEAGEEARDTQRRLVPAIIGTFGSAK